MTLYLDEQVQNYLSWLKDVKHSPYQTFRAYQVDLTQFLKYFLRIDKNELPGKEDMEEYIGYIKNKFNYASYRRKVTVLRNFTRYLVQSGITVPDPFVSISLPMPDINFNMQATYSDVLQLIESLPESDFTELRDKLIFCLIAKCGLTIKQLLSLKIKDINLAAGQIIFSKDQMTFMDNKTIEIAGKYIASLPESPSLDDYLISNHQKNKLPLSPRTIHLIIDNISKKTNSKQRLSPTILRRLFAKSLTERNVNKETKELILGKKCRLVG